MRRQANEAPGPRGPHAGVVLLLAACVSCVGVSILGQMLPGTVCLFGTSAPVYVFARRGVCMYLHESASMCSHGCVHLRAGASVLCLCLLCVCVRVCACACACINIEKE